MTQKALTNREREIMAEVAEGFSTAVIAHHLHIGARVVEVHRASAVAKLGARNSVHAAVLFDRHARVATTQPR